MTISNHAQFLRIETYAKKASPNSTGKKVGSAQTVEAVLREVQRDPAYSKHVNKQSTLNRPPQLIYDGLTNSNSSVAAWAEQIEHRLYEQLESSEKTYTRRKKGSDETITITTKTPETQQILLAGVLSAPDGLDKNILNKWANKSIEWLKKEYGNQLKGVVLHRDESCPHIHFYAVPDRPDLDAAYLHPGETAKRLARLEMKKTKKKIALNPLYKQAMRQFQDSYYQAVARDLGFKRKADRGYNRLPRDEYLAVRWYKRRVNQLIDKQAKTNHEYNKKLNYLNNKIKKAENIISKNNPKTWQLLKINRFIKSLISNRDELLFNQKQRELDLIRDREITEVQRQYVEQRVREGKSWELKFSAMEQTYQDKIRSIQKKYSHLNQRLDEYELPYPDEKEAKNGSKLGYALYRIFKDLEPAFASSNAPKNAYERLLESNPDDYLKIADSVGVLARFIAENVESLIKQRRAFEGQFEPDEPEEEGQHQRPMFTLTADEMVLN